MANMSYCRFENTYRDLQDCYNDLCEDCEKELSSDYEERARKNLLELCQQIAEEFGEEE